MYISTNVDTYIKSETDILKEETREIFKVGTETWKGMEMTYKKRKKEGEKVYERKRGRERYFKRERVG